MPLKPLPDHYLDAMAYVGHSHTTGGEKSPAPRPIDINARPLILPPGVSTNQVWTEAHDSALMFAAQDNTLFLRNWLGGKTSLLQLGPIRAGHRVRFGAYEVSMMAPNGVVVTGPDSNTGGLMPSLAARRQWYAVLRAAVPVDVNERNKIIRANRVHVGRIDWATQADAGREWGDRVVSSMLDMSAMKAIAPSQRPNAVDTAALVRMQQESVWREQEAMIRDMELRLGPELDALRSNALQLPDELVAEISKAVQTARPLPSPPGASGSGLSPRDIFDALKGRLTRRK